MFNPRKELIIILFLFIAPLGAYWQVQNHDFLGYDDNEYITKNIHVQKGLTLNSLVWALTSNYAANWHPLTWLSHMIDYSLYGLNPRGHHLSNLLLHIANILLLYLILKIMTGALWKSAFVAALFGLHPIHVESVAWVAERKDVLSAFFWMLTIWAYVGYSKHQNLSRYLLTLILFSLGLMSKPMLVTLPFILLLLDYWPLNRPPPGEKRLIKNIQLNKFSYLIIEKIPFFILAAVSSIVTFIVQKQGETVTSIALLPFNIRIGNALVSYIKYIGKMLWPYRLAVFYPYPRDILELNKTLYAGFLLLIISILVLVVIRRFKYLTVGWFWYLITLVPVIGIVQVGEQSMADRYTYLPFIGLFLIVAWGVPDLLAKWRFQKTVLAISAWLLILTLSIGTWLQTRHWKNSLTLFTHADNVTKNNYIAQFNLGNVFLDQGKLDLAKLHYNNSLRIKPDHEKTHYNLGIVQFRKGDIHGAIAHYSESLKIRPNNVKARNNLGYALFQQGKLHEAIFHYTEALRVKPDFQDVLNNMGNALAGLGKYNEALLYYTKALQLNPNNEMAHNNLGNILSKQGKYNKAITHYTNAIGINPNFIDGYNNLGLSLIEQGKLEQALYYYSEGLKNNPSNPEILNGLGSVLLQKNKIKEAITHFSNALKIRPNFPNAQNNLKIAKQMLKQ